MIPKMIAILSLNWDQLGYHYKCPVDPCIAINKMPDFADLSQIPR